MMNSNLRPPGAVERRFKGLGLYRLHQELQQGLFRA
jgi:hypothetical protein